MKRISFVVSIVILAVVAGVGYWFNTIEKRDFDNSSWLSSPGDDVRSIHVQGANGSILLESVKGGWKARIPSTSENITAHALPDRVAEYVQRITEIAPYRSVVGFDRGGPEAYGLESPQLVVTLSFAKANSENLIIKMAPADNGSVYAWSSRSPSLVYEFDKDVLGLLDVETGWFLDKRVFQFDEKAISRLQLLQPFGSSWLVEKRKDGYFFNLPGYLKDEPASNSQLNLYIHSLALLRANGLVMEPVNFDNKIPSLTLRVWSGDKEEPSTVAFYTVEGAPDIYMGKSSWLTVPFILDGQSVAQLTHSAFDIQGRSVLKLDIGKVARFIVMHGRAEYEMQRGEKSWRLLGVEKDIPGIDMFLWRFTELQFEALPLNNLPGTAMPLLYCKLVDEKGGALADITFYADPKLPQGQCWMKNGDGMYYPVSSRLLKDLQGMFPANVSSANG